MIDFKISINDLILLCVEEFAYDAYFPITLDSGIDVAPGINVAPPLKFFHIMILTLFYINLGIAVISKFFLYSKIFKN